MNINTLKQTLPILMNAKVVPFIWGMMGIGKTEVVKQVNEEINGKGAGFVHLLLSNQEVGDLIGLLDKDTSTSDKVVRHLRPEWLPVDGDDNPETGIIFLDEFNRAQPDVIQAVFTFLLEGKLHRHKLKAGWRIVAAGNYNTNDFNTTDTSDKALVSRFCHIDLKPSIQEWITYGEKTNAVNLDLREFFAEKSDLLDKKGEPFSLDFVTPTRRSAELLTRIMEQKPSVEILREVAIGMLGPVAAAAFMNFYETREKAIDIEKIMNNYPEVRDRIQKITKADGIRMDLLNTAVDSLVKKMEENQSAKVLTVPQCENIRAFVYDLPREVAYKFIGDILTIEGSSYTEVFFNNKDFCQYLKDLQAGLEKNAV